jgi:DNA-directed RNA polymerase subunit RPC12/RpoP
VSECSCGQPTRDDAYTCDTCGDRFARALGDIPWLVEELETTITKQRAAVEGDGSASAETPLMYHLPAAEKRDALRAALVTAVRFCNEEGVRNSDPGPEWPKDNLESMSRWLLWRVDGLALNDMGEQMAQGVRDAVRACRRVIDKPPERAYAGPCPECKRDLYHRHDAAEVSCRGCGSRWDVSEMNDWMRRRINEHMTDRLVTAREGSTLLGRFGLPIEQGTIDKWHTRNRLVESGRNKAGHRLYRWDALLALAARHARTPA